MKKLVLILLLFAINVFSQTIPTYSHDSGTRSPIWKIGLKGGAIKWENDSLLYKALWNNQGGSVFGDSAYFVLTKNATNLPQLITGEKYFYKSAIDTLTVRMLRLQLGYLIDPLTLHWGDMIFHGSGLNSFFIFKTAPISGWEWLDTLVSRKYMRYRYESGTDSTFNFVYRSKYLANGYAKEIPYQIGSGITGFIPAPTDTNYVLTGAMKWKAINESGTIIDTTTFSRVGHTHAFSEITSKPTTLSGYGITDGVSTSSTYHDPSWLASLIWTKISSKPTTLSGYGISDGVTITDFNSALATKITNPPNAYGFLANDGFGNIGWGGSAQFQTMWENTIGTNYYTKTNLQTSGQAQVHFNNLTNKPTTLSGYGITDGVSLSANNTFTGINTFRDILFSGTGKFYLPTSDMTTNGTMFLNNSTIKYYTTTGTLYSLATTTDLSNGLASKITNPTNANGVLKNDGTGIIYWQAITGTDISNGLGYTPTYVYDSGTSTSSTWSSNKINTDYYTKTNLQTSGQAQVHFNNLTNKPTTLSGYGITDGVQTSRTITINGTTQDLSANRSWNIIPDSTLAYRWTNKHYYYGAANSSKNIIDVNWQTYTAGVTLKGINSSVVSYSNPTAVNLYAGYFNATGSGTSGGSKTYGIYANASIGNEVYSGYFDNGQVYIKDNLNVGQGQFSIDNAGRITKVDGSFASGYNNYVLMSDGTSFTPQNIFSKNITWTGKQTFIDSVSFKGSMLLADEDSVYLANNASWSASGKNALTICSVDNNYTLTITSGVNGQMLWVTNSITSLFTLNITPIRYGTSTTLGLAAGKSVLLRYKNGEWYVASL